MSVPVSHPVVATDTELVDLLTKLSNTTRAFSAHELAAIGLWVGEDEVLIALDEARLVSVSQLATKLDTPLSTASKIVDRMASVGYVVRMDKPGTHPETLVRLSAAGAAMKIEARAVRAKMEEFLRGASAPQLTAALVESLPSAHDLIAGHLKELDPKM